jgi:hypothetical protein
MLSVQSENGQYGLGVVIQVVVYLLRHIGMLGSGWKLGTVHAGSARGQRLFTSPVRA